MSDSTLPGILWVLGLAAGLGTVGRFIDFYIGNTRQKALKEWVLKGWVAFEDMRWHNFSQNEARTFIFWFDRAFGERLLSWRRLTSCVAVFTAYVVVYVVVYEIYRRDWSHLPQPTPEYAESTEALYALLFGCTLFGFAMSFTRWTSVMTIKLASKGRLGFAAYVLLLVFHYELFVLWRPIVEAGVFYARATSVHAALEHASESAVSLYRYQLNWHLGGILSVDFEYFEKLARLGHSNYYPAIHGAFVWAAELEMWTGGALRLIFGSILFLSFVMREVLSRAFSTLWARVYEDEKGVFTLLLGATGVLAGGVKALLGGH
jgi:hypothetical protein